MAPLFSIGGQMFNFPAFGPEWMVGFGAIWFALMLGKLMRQQTVVLTVALIGAILTESWVGVFVAPLLCMTLYPVDIARKVS